MTLAADDLLAALQALQRAPAGPRDAHVALLAAEGARVLAAANLMNSMASRLRRPDLAATDAAQGMGLLVSQLRRQAAQVGGGCGPDHPAHAQIESLRATWLALADAAESLSDAPGDRRQDALMHAELSWRRAHAELQRQQQGAPP